MNEKLFSRIKDKKQRLDILRRQYTRDSTPFNLRPDLRISHTHFSNICGSQLVIGERVPMDSRSRNELLIRNYDEAVEVVKKSARLNLPLTDQMVLDLHALLFRGSRNDAGEYRTRGLTIIGPNCLPATQVLFAIPHMIAEYNCNSKKLGPIELSAWVHHHFVLIHPFRDGNGRVARLLLNFTLIRDGYPWITILMADRMKYLIALQEANAGNPESFVDFVATYVEQSLDKDLLMLKTLGMGLI